MSWNFWTGYVNLSPLINSENHEARILELEKQVKRLEMIVSDIERVAVVNVGLKHLQDLRDEYNSHHKGVIQP